jgi:hypothetical protein
VNGYIAYIKVQKKDGSILNAIIDEKDLKSVLEKGNWFVRWQKDLNGFEVQILNEVLVSEKKLIKKQSLQSFLLGVHPKTPIKYINGDTLDNRRANLEICEQNKVNDFEELRNDTIAIILRDKFGKENGRTLIDKDDLSRVHETGYCWVYHKPRNKPYAVANTPTGRIYLNRFIMQTPEKSYTKAINLNTLDNRKCNLENITPDEK